MPQDILVALADTFRNGTYSPPLPVKMLMLDAYWMYNTRANGNCKINDTAWPLPFPLGLQYLSTATGLPLIIYNGPQCDNSTYASQWPLELSLPWDQGWGKGVLSAIAANASQAFYSATFAALKAQGMGSFTQDFLDFQSLLFPAFLTSPEGNGLWLAGQAQAAAEAGLAVQYCMALPADILASADFPAVTNARASQDYGAGGDNWRIGGSSLLLSALQLRASKDNFWSGPPNARGWESSPFLQAAVCALSRGPVGFADPLLGTNPLVLWPTMALNGTLLHPSRPASYLDAVWLGLGALAGSSATLTHCAIASPDSSSSATLTAYSLLAPTAAAAAAVPGSLTLGDLWPAPPSATQRYALWAWNTPGCQSGGPAEACLVELGGAGSGASGAAPVPTPSGDKVQWALWHASPVLASGYVLLGELGKFVPLSPDRFAGVGLGAGGVGVGVQLLGAPGEAVTLAFARPGGQGGFGLVVLSTLVLDATGRLTATLQ